MTFPFVWICVCAIIGILPLHTFVVFLTLPIAIGCAKTMNKSAAQDDHTLLSDLDVRTAQLQMLFSALLSIALIAARLI